MVSIRTMLDHDRALVARGANHVSHVSWKAQFEAIGAHSLRILDKLCKGGFDEEVFRMLLVGKSKAYGDKPIRAWGPLGVIIRIDSKLLRYENLIANPEVELKDESCFDTVQDILGYSILGYQLVTTGGY